MILVGTPQAGVKRMAWDGTLIDREANPEAAQTA
jgi:hypothetical protein